MKNKPILFCVGTRPEWIKVLPIISNLDKSEYRLYFTGQHFDLLSKVEFDYIAPVGNRCDNRLDNVIFGCVSSFPNGDFKGVVVQGDTASAFGCAVAAFNRNIPIYYLESGLRTFDLQNPYPEEGYRQMISRIANFNFAPTELAKDRLVAEGIRLDSIYVTGNTVLDNLVDVTPIIYNDSILVTLHRRENHVLMYDWFCAIDELAKTNKHLTFILPIHPNPNVLMYKNVLKHVKVIEPLDHKDLLNVLKTCRFVITDSGGIQEEASFLHKKSIVCRVNTERPEGILTGHTVLCDSPKNLQGIFNSVVEDYEIHEACPYGDGNSSERVIKILRT